MPIVENRGEHEYAILILTQVVKILNYNSSGTVNKLWVAVFKHSLSDSATIFIQAEAHNLRVYNIYHVLQVVKSKVNCIPFMRINLTHLDEYFLNHMVAVVIIATG